MCGIGLLIHHPDQKTSIYLRIKQDGKLMMSLDVLSKNPCTYADNQLICEMEFTA